MLSIAFVKIMLAHLDYENLTISLNIK